MGARRLVELQEQGRYHSVASLGLDLSLGGTGAVLWAEGIGGEPRIIAHRRISTHSVPGNRSPKNKIKVTASGVVWGTDEQRIEWIRSRIEWLLKRWHKHILVCGIEGHAYSFSNNKTATTHELHGVIKNLLHQYEIPFIIIQPKSLKLRATGDGSASKVEMISAAKPYFPRVWNDDEADALHLARAVLQDLTDMALTGF